MSLTSAVARPARPHFCGRIVIGSKGNVTLFAEESTVRYLRSLIRRYRSVNTVYATALTRESSIHQAQIVG
jgi:hypothetical protein